MWVLQSYFTLAGATTLKSRVTDVMGRSNLAERAPCVGNYQKDAGVRRFLWLADPTLTHMLVSTCGTAMNQ